MVAAVSDSGPDDAGETYELVMPFVACVSEGGDYDDDGYAAGWEMGALDVRLADIAGAAPYLTTIHAGNVRQLDLVAMKHGWRVDLVSGHPDSATVEVLLRRLSHPAA